MAKEQNCSLQECQESNTSSEFVEWKVYYQELVWQEKEKQDYYLAQIAAEIRRIGTVFGGDKKKTSILDCILPFEMPDDQVKDSIEIPDDLELVEEKAPEEIQEEDLVEKPARWTPDAIFAAIESGDTIELSPKEQAAADLAKQEWAARLGKEIGMEDRNG